MSIRRDVHGFTVLGDDAVDEGVSFLDFSLGYPEAKVFFDQARARGKAQFQDSQRRDYTLKYNGDGTYTVLKRRESKGFFSGWF